MADRPVGELTIDGAEYDGRQNEHAVYVRVYFRDHRWSLRASSFRYDLDRESCKQS